MFTDLEIQDLSKRHQRTMVCGMLIGIAGLFAFFGLIFLTQEWFVHWVTVNFGAATAGIANIFRVFAAVAFFLLSLVIAERKAKEFALECPHCSEDVTRAYARILKTRCCYRCGNRIIEGGKLRAPDVYGRYARRMQKRFLAYWFWAWPALAFVTLTWHWFDPSALRSCVHVLFVPGLVGTIATGWTLARTNDRRYFPQMCVSAVMLMVGGLAFWNAI